MFLIKNNEALLIAPNLLIFPKLLYFFLVILSIGNKFIYIFMIYYLFTFTGLWFTKSSIMYQNKISWNLNPHIYFSYIVKKKQVVENGENLYKNKYQQMFQFQ